MAFQGVSSSSLSPSLHWWTYDVFLNFRGEDTRKGFTAYLHEALDQKKINTYIDYKLPRGEEISEELLKAIESSRISIVVLSKNYASSTWCLDELIKILECKNTKHQKVLPVFYNVSPTEVRHQRASFEEALAKLKDRLKDEMKVQRWKEALKEVATLSGFNLEDRCEPEIIQEIVREVLRSINVKYLNVVEHLVGMQSRVQDVRNKLLSVEVNDTTRILGIFGIGGVGKTTLAKGTNKIEGILIDLPKEDLIHLSPGAFKKMPNLRVLINRNAFFSELPNYFSNKLRVLDFKNYHGTTFPSNFNGEKLVALRMEYCLIYKELGNKFKNFQNLKFLNFKECEFLTRIPDTSGLPNLEQLDIFSCKRLVEVDQSIGSCSKLVKLLIRCCPLNSFPSSLNSRSLKELIVEWCPSLVSFPKIGLEMKCLTLIKWSFTGIKELPSSIENLTELRELDLEGNNNLAHIPSSILQLEHLSRLDLDGCTEIITYPKLTDYLSLRSLPPSKLDSSMFTNCFSTLTELDLSRRTFVILPGWMNRFVRLRKLDLEYCKQLKKIEELPPNIEEVDASGCISLESFPEVSKRFEFNTSKLSELHSINLTGCSKMLVNVGSHVTATLRAQEATGYGNSTGLLFPGNKIPNWFYHCKETSNTSSRDTLIEIELLNLSVIKGILTCAVFETSTAHCAHICIAVNYDGRCLGTIERSIRLMGPDDVLLDFHDLDPFTLAKGSLQLHFHCDLYGKGLLQRCGVHLVRKDEEA